MLEIELAKKAIAGDEQAFIEIHELYEEVLYRIASSYFHNEHDAIEVIQELTYRSFKKIHTVKEPAYLGTWLVRILLNVCHDMQKKKSRMQLRDTVEIGEYHDNSSLELREALAKLSHEQQELIFLKYFRDMKNQDIAEVQNIPEGTVKSRLHTALQKLRLFFKEEDAK